MAIIYTTSAANNSNSNSNNHKCKTITNTINTNTNTNTRNPKAAVSVSVSASIAISMQQSSSSSSSNSPTFVSPTLTGYTASYSFPTNLTKWAICPCTGIKLAYFDQAECAFAGTISSPLLSCHPIFLGANVLSLRTAIRHATKPSDVSPCLIAGDILFLLTTKSRAKFAKGNAKSASANAVTTNATTNPSKPPVSLANSTNFNSDKLNLANLSLANDALAAMPYAILLSTHATLLSSSIDFDNLLLPLHELVETTKHKISNNPAHTLGTTLASGGISPLASAILNFIRASTTEGKLALRDEATILANLKADAAKRNEENLLTRLVAEVPSQDAIVNIKDWVNYIRPKGDEQAIKLWAPINAMLSFNLSCLSLDDLATLLNFLRARKSEADKLGVGKESSLWRTINAKARYYKILTLLSDHYQTKLDRLAGKTLASLVTLPNPVPSTTLTAKSSKAANSASKLASTILGTNVIPMVLDDDSEV